MERLITKDPGKHLTQERLRKPFEGVGNIVRFNWHFYVLAAAAALALLLLSRSGAAPVRLAALVLLALVVATTAVSLLVSYYVYDRSGLYSLAWLESAAPPSAPAGSPTSLPASAVAGALPSPAAERGLVVNIHAGFDETSRLLRRRFALAELRVFDFYDAEQHTEVSIRRARAACPPYPGTERVRPERLPLPDGGAAWVFVVLAAHEIRQPAQRAAFFQELRRISQPNGTIVVVEHLRDTANFLAYTIGFLHFYSGALWRRVFRAAALGVAREKKLTPFLSAFFLTARGEPA